MEQNPVIRLIGKRPLRSEDLLQRPTTASLDRDSSRPWPWLFAGGVQLAMPHPAFIADDAEAERLAAVEGLGFGQFPGFSIAADLAAGRLQRVLTDCEPDPWPLYLYRPQRGPVPARIRALFDHLQHALTTLPTAPAT
ncbi:LysR substrate-binding domain-containing protein [Uliginosibacterium paludis]|uniref:LysR substrate-binding domain-containing protein n=1 Tax=Uliginosibacterium paludis TaxID=1615952 RepID=A0ABV2CTR7_9RHOO